MLNLSLPAFKKKLVKGKGKARTRANILEDLDPVVVQAVKLSTPEPESAPKVSRWAQYAKLAKAHETLEKAENPSDNTTAKDENGGQNEVVLSPQFEGLKALDPDAPVIVDTPTTLSELEPSTAGKVYIAPKTFLLRESHFRDKPVEIEKEYDTLSDDEPAKVAYEDDEPMVDDSFVHDNPARFDLEMYESEIVSMASEDERKGRIKVTDVSTLEELIASFTQKIQELLLSTEARKREIAELKLRLDTAVATKKRVLAQLHTLA